MEFKLDTSMMMRMREKGKRRNFGWKGGRKTLTAAKAARLQWTRGSFTSERGSSSSLGPGICRRAGCGRYSDNLRRTCSKVSGLL
jgi:hypothetical protein